jgi:CHAT domain-containing protein
LLGQLVEADEAEAELRLLSDADYAVRCEAVEDELIDQYLEGSLVEEERAQFEQHFLKAPERKDDLVLAEALRKVARESLAGRPAAAPHTPSYRRSAGRDFFKGGYLKAAAVIVIALGVGFGVWFSVSRGPGESQGMADLRAAYKNQRLIESRVTNLDYAPLAIKRGQEKPDIDEASLRRAELQLLKDLDEHPNATVHHALGRLYLAGGQFDKSIEYLELALNQEPNDAQTHSDLGAALLEKGKAELADKNSGKSLEYFARSLEEINKADELDGSLLEALYNRAIVHQYMMSPRQAEDDWKKYLEKDSSSQWAIEARQNLKLLEDKRNGTSKRQEQSLNDLLRAYSSEDDRTAWEIYTHSHTSSGNTITNTLLDSYLNSQASGNGDEALKSIQAVAYLGRIELRVTGDHYLSDLAQFYGSTTLRQRDILSVARNRIKQAYELSAQSKLTDAMNAFALARQDFERAGDVGEAIFADYAIARCCALQPDISKGLNIFNRIIPTCESRSYKWLLTQCLRGTAHLQLNLNDYSEAIDSSTRALNMSEQVQDPDSELQGLIQIADMYQSLNDNEKSLSYLGRGLMLAQDNSPGPMQTWGIYVALAFDFDALGYYRAALDYQREALQIALDTRRPLIISRSYEYVGLTCGSLKLYAEAIHNVQLAYQQGQALSSERNGLNMMANASLKLGDLYRLTGDQIQAAESYDRSIGLYNELGFPYYSYSAHKGKLLIYLKQRNDALASEELQTVLRLFEQNREKITEERQRDIYFDNEQSVYDLAIEFELSRADNPRRAFEYSEMSRARSLLDLLRSGGRVVEKEYGPDLRTRPGAMPLSLSEIQERMPDQAQILQYAVLDDKLLIWVLSKTDFSSKIVNVDSKVLNNEVASYLKHVGSPSEADALEASKNSRTLYDLLIKPVEVLLSRNRILYLVPDKILNYVPFGALISTTTGRYLIEDYGLTLSPSSTIFIDCSSTAREKAVTKGERLLSVGDPRFDRSTYPELSELPSAAREAEEITAYYGSARLLLRDDARVSQVKAELQRSDVAHFAAHYVIDQRSNMRSKLLLAEEPAGEVENGRADGALEPWEIYQMRLQLTRLVVLSGCQTGIEHQYDGEGPISFARPFIAAGVPLVIASLWPVDSGATTELMISFHRHRKRDPLPTAEALRRAQLDMLESQDPRYQHPYYWAPFATIGGYAAF